ncbi:MAG: DUF2283 domain-containing protein [Candidatus Marsarchaeota archaeon]|jgi:uncharacterized protein YuzE|nr:DUF2283 domain-containing protein [Candidatus Marsarchaeota archaeon]
MKRYFLEYDSDADAAYIRINPKGKIKESVRLEENVIADIDRNNKIVGLEILNFSRMKVKLNEFIVHQFENLAVTG